MLQVLPAPPVNTGLSDLGQALLGGATDYANRKFTLDEEAKKRANYLADIQSERGYQGQQFDKLRALQLADEQRRRGETMTDAQKRAQFDNRLRLLQEAEGRGLFDAKDIGNIPVEDAALAQLQQQAAKESTFTQAQPGNAQARQIQLGQLEDETMQKMSALEAKHSAQPTIDQAAVAALAVQMATQNNSGKMPSREQIAAAAPDALTKIQTEVGTRWYQEKQDDQLQYTILANQLNAIRQERGTLATAFKVAPTASPLVAAPVAVAPMAAARSGDPLAGFTSALNAQLDKRGLTGPTGVPDSGSLLSGPTPPTMDQLNSALTMAPTEDAKYPIRAARTNLLVSQLDKAWEPVAQTKAELADVTHKLQLAQAGLNPYQGVTQEPLPDNPAVKGELITKLLMQASALQNKLKQNQDQYGQGKTGILSQIPRINTMSSSTPPPIVSPGSVLSDPYSNSSYQSGSGIDPYQ